MTQISSGLVVAMARLGGSTAEWKAAGAAELYSVNTQSILAKTACVGSEPMSEPPPM